MPACKLDILRQHVREPAITVAVPAKGLVFQRVFEQAVQKRRARGVVTVALQRRHIGKKLRKHQFNDLFRPLAQLFILRAVLHRIVLIKRVFLLQRLHKRLQQLIGRFFRQRLLHASGDSAFRRGRLVRICTRIFRGKRRLQRRGRKRRAAARSCTACQRQKQDRRQQQR